MAAGAVARRVMAGWLRRAGRLVNGETVRFGIKFGLAGVLALYLALLTRIPEPTWALFTVFVLMVAQYVGAMAEKSVLRLIGTALGGVAGYLLTACFEQDPIIFLALVGVFTAFCTAMFGQDRFSYAFLLCALTTIVVAGNGMAEPEHSWDVALTRIEQICIGIVASLLVNNLVWPRYARVEFLAKARGAFADVRDCFTATARVLLHGRDEAACRLTDDFPARMTGMRTLLHFGARESHYFRSRLAIYGEITSALSRIASAIRTLGHELPARSAYRSVVAEELECIHGAITAALDALSRSLGATTARHVHLEAVDAAFVRFEQRMVGIRELPEVRAIPAEESMTYGVHALALEDIREQIKRASEAIESLPDPPLRAGAGLEMPGNVIPPLTWMRTGVKSGIAVVIALVIVNWLQPPGGSMIVLGAWVFTALNPFAPGGEGDRRAFHYVVFAGIAMIGVALVLLAATPLLSDYAVLNGVIFVTMFAWGCEFRRIGGITVPMQIAMLATVGMLGLNAQRPVGFQAVAGVYFGIVIGLLIAACVQRILWPVLPQWRLRDGLIEYARHCAGVIERGAAGLPLAGRVRMALIPVEAAAALRALERIPSSGAEPALLAGYLLSLRRIAADLTVSTGRLGPLLTGGHAARGVALIAELEAALKAGLEAHAESLAGSRPLEASSGSLVELLERWEAWLAEFRAWMIETHHPIPEAIRIIGLSGRYEQAGHNLLTANNQAARLPLDRMMSDYAL
jgi:uncharacterized membrane protein YccC